MKETQIRARFKKIKGATLLNIQRNGDGKIVHAEIQSDNGLLWKWPFKSRSRCSSKRWQNYGIDWKGFTYQRPDYNMLSMERFVV